MFNINWKYFLVASWAFLLLAGINVVNPIFTEVYGRLLEIVHFQNQATPLDLIEEEIELLKASNHRINDKIQGILLDTPSRNHLSMLYGKLASYAAEHHVGLSKILPRPVEKGQKFYELELESEIQGDYKNILKFLYTLEQTEGVFRILQLDIYAAKKKQGLLEGKIRLGIYLK